MNPQSITLCGRAELLSMHVHLGRVVHGLQTVSSVQRRDIELVGQPETEYSWFPGYAWTIAQCRTCGGHLGWRFTATNEELRPQTFWGLSLASIQT